MTDSREIARIAGHRIGQRDTRVEAADENCLPTAAGQPGHGDSLRVVTVAPFSPAYFALLRALPELVQPAALQPAVLVAGRRVSVKIQEGGLEEWGDGEITRLVREFR